MLESILKFISDLQKNGTLPDGRYSHNYWEQPASYICHILLGEGYYIKKYKNRGGLPGKGQANIKAQFEQECQALKTIFPLFAESDKFEIPELVFTDSKQLIIVTKELKGQSFEVVCSQFAWRVGRKENNALSACQNVGKFLKNLHTHNRQELNEEDVSELISYIKDRISPYLFSKNEIQLIHKGLLALQEKAMTDISVYYKCSVHHDLNPTNILVDDKKINVLDFADYRIDSPFQDIVYFPLMLSGQLGNRIKYRKRIKDTLLDAFITSYMVDSDFPLKLDRNALYDLYLLKNLAIFSKTFSEMKKGTMGLPSPGVLKMRLVLEIDCRKVKKQILEIVSAW